MTFKQKVSSYIEALWWEHATPPLPLRLFEKIYAPISRNHLQKRAASTVTPPLPMISVGNITAGGSGKTPFVIWLAGQLKENGYAPVVLCRGDGGSSERPQVVKPDATADTVGDEALLLAQSCRCPVISGRNRVAASTMAKKLGDIIILDDGFQYRQLERACDIVLIPAEGIGNGHLIPAGPLREPLEQLQRADLIVRTGDTDSTAITDGREWHWSAETLPPVDIKGIEKTLPPSFLAVTAIARPGRFIHALHQQGLDIAEQRIFPDHYRFTREETEDFASAPWPVVITAKDAVKIAPVWPEGRPLWVAQQQATAERGLIDAILAMLPGRKRA